MLQGINSAEIPTESNPNPRQRIEALRSKQRRTEFTSSAKPMRSRGFKIRVVDGI